MKHGKTKLIKENIAPKGTTKVVLFNDSNEKVCEIRSRHLTPPRQTRRLYSFLALSDAHVPYKTGADDHRVALTYASECNEIDFVVECGDLTANGSESEMNDWRTSVDTYLPNKPMYAITGNHENYSSSSKRYNISDYIGHPLYYSFTQGDDVFIMVGCYAWYEGNVELKGDILSVEELQWLYETLEINRNKRCFVFFHVFPWGDCGNAGGIYKSNMFIGTKCEVFLALMRHYSNVILFHGHSHLRYELQEIDKKANYSSANGYKSVHISSLCVPRDISTSEKEYETLHAESEGYYVDVYKNGIHLNAMNFITKEFIPIASYWIDTTLIKIEANTFKDSTGTINV